MKTLRALWNHVAGQLRPTTVSTADAGQAVATNTAELERIHEEYPAPGVLVYSLNGQPVPEIPYGASEFAPMGEGPEGIAV